MKLASLIKIALPLARRNVPFRGHRDDSKYYDKENSGNFQALFNFRIAAEVMNKKIIAEIKKSKFFFIIAVEVTDCSNKEQMPLVIRFVDGSNIIQERFIKFIHCNEGVSGEALKDKIIDCLVNELNLDVENCRGQCYDGAGNMAGKYSGVAARILNLNPLALFTHCASHRLNLCAAVAFENQNVSNMMDRVKQISEFFNYSPKRQQLLEENTKKFNPDCKYTKLLDVYRTRWILHIDGLARFLEMYEAIVETMFVNCSNKDGKWRTCAGEAYSFQTLLLNFNFFNNADHCKKLPWVYTYSYGAASRCTS